MTPEVQEAWKRKIFERVKADIYKDADWETFSEQTDQFVFVFGGEGLSEGQVPPHGKNEIWLPNLMEREIMKQYREAAIKEGLAK